MNNRASSEGGSPAGGGPRAGDSSWLRPSFSTADATRLAAERYGVEGSARELPSERDQNFLLTLNAGESFVLKIHNLGEDATVVDLQNRALKRLAAADTGFRFPEVLPSNRGREVESVRRAEGGEFLVRLLRFVEGEPLARVRPHDPQLLRQAGRFLGIVDRELSELQHPAGDRILAWDLRRGRETVRDRLELLDGTEREMVEGFLALFEDRATPLLSELRVSLIHNDANDHNVLVTGRALGSTQPRQIAGIIDFGDMVRSWTAGEIAVAAAYGMLGKPAPLDAAADVVGGYHSILALTEPELEALYPLICLRLCMSVAMSAAQRAWEPGNEYLSISEDAAWKLLQDLRAVDPSFAHYRLRDACGLEAVPRVGEVEVWLETHGPSCGPVVPVDSRKGATVLLDLSVGSTELGAAARTNDPEAWSRLIFGRMEAEGASVAVGRYNEPRAWYSSPLFRQGGNQRPEWRTVHLGIDLFVRPGTPVMAPLDGTVHSFRDNQGHLDYGPTIVLHHAPSPGGLEFSTLYGHLSRDSLDGLRPGERVRKGETLGRVGAHTENGGWAPHLHFQIVTDMLGREGEFPGVAPPSQRSLWLTLSPDPNLILGIPELRRGEREQGRGAGGRRADEREFEPGELLEARRRLLGPNLSVSYRRPLKIVRGWMAHLFDELGQPYLDLVNNVAHVGHGHPRVVEAIQRQCAVLNTNTRYLHDLLVRYAERLTATLPEPLSVCYFVCSGSEANELALRLARAHTGHEEFIVVEGAYHGNTGALVDLSPYKFDGPGGRGPPRHVHTVPMPDTYRGRYRSPTVPDAGPRYAAHVGEAAREIQHRGRGLCAFLCEPLLSCGGQIVLPDEYLRDAYRYVREAGGVCVADEVQVGFGRVGSHFWGFETQGVTPDIVTMGKPMGNGHPVGAVVTTREIASSFETGMEYFNTFGGNPVSCAAGLAVLDVIAEEKLLERASRIGTRLMKGLGALRDGHPVVGDVRGLGLFLGLELVLDREARAPAGDHAGQLVERMRESGFLLSTDGPDRNVIKIKPPLVIEDADADDLLEVLDGVLGEDAFRLG